MNIFVPEFRQHESRQPADGAAAGNQDALIRAKSKSIDGMQRHSEGLGHGGDIIGQFVWQLVSQALRQHGVFGKSAVAGLADKTECGAEVPAFTEAGGTDAAPEARVGHYAVADRQAFDLSSKRCDSSHELMARHRWRAGDPLAGREIVEIGATDSGGIDSDPHPARWRCLRRCNVLDAEIALGMEPHGFHGSDRSQEAAIDGEALAGDIG